MTDDFSLMEIMGLDWIVYVHVPVRETGTSIDFPLLKKIDFPWKLVHFLIFGIQVIFRKGKETPFKVKTFLQGKFQIGMCTMDQV